jgi:hypothetical protein
LGVILTKLNFFNPTQIFSTNSNFFNPTKNNNNNNNNKIIIIIKITQGWPSHPWVFGGG